MSVGVRPAGDRALLLELASNADAVLVARRARAELRGVVDVVPGHETVLLTFEAEPRPDEAVALAEAALADDHSPPESALVELAVTYDGPDLAEVAELVAGSHHRRAQPTHQVGRAAAEHGLDVDPAAHGHVDPRAACIRLDREHVARCHLECRPVLGTGQRDDRGLEEAKLWPGQRRLQRGGARPVADQPVAALVRARIRRTRRRDAEMRQTRPPAVLDGGQRPAVEHLDHRATNRTWSPDASSAGGSREGSKSTASVRPSSRQPPGDSRG